MKSLKYIGAFALVIIITSSLRAQEEQWTNYIGKPFDSVVSVVKARCIACEKEIVTNPLPEVQATCLPYEFLGEYGILVLRRSSRGLVETCSWLRGDFAPASGEIAKLKAADRGKLSVKAGDLDKAFDAAWEHYTKKFGVTMDATDDGGYIWRGGQGFQYVLSRGTNHVEFSMIRSEGQYGDASVPSRQVAIN